MGIPQHIRRRSSHERSHRVSDNHHNTIAPPGGIGEARNDEPVREGKAAPEDLRPAPRRVVQILQGWKTQRQPDMPAFRHTPPALPPLELGQKLRQAQAVHPGGQADRAEKKARAVAREGARAQGQGDAQGQPHVLREEDTPYPPEDETRGERPQRRNHRQAHSQGEAVLPRWTHKGAGNSRRPRRKPTRARESRTAFRKARPSGSSSST